MQPELPGCSRPHFFSTGAHVPAGTLLPPGFIVRGGSGLSALSTDTSTDPLALAEERLQSLSERSVAAAVEWLSAAADAVASERESRAAQRAAAAPQPPWGHRPRGGGGSGGGSGSCGGGPSGAAREVDPHLRLRAVLLIEPGRAVPLSEAGLLSGGGEEFAVVARHMRWSKGVSAAVLRLAWARLLGRAARAADADAAKRAVPALRAAQGRWGAAPCGNSPSASAAASSSTTASAVAAMSAAREAEDAKLALYAAVRCAGWWGEVVRAGFRAGAQEREAAAGIERDRRRAAEALERVRAIAAAAGGEGGAASTRGA